MDYKAKPATIAARLDANFPRSHRFHSLPRRVVQRRFGVPHAPVLRVRVFSFL